MLACAVLSLLGTVAYTMGPAVSGDQASNVSGGGARLGSGDFLSLLVAAGLYGVAVGALTIALTAFCAQHHAQPAVGLLIAIWGAGSIIGGLAYGSRNWTGPPAQRALTLLAVLAIILALLNLAGSVLILALIMFALGVPLSPWLGTLNSALQELVPTERATEGFTWSSATITTGTAVGSAAAGPLTSDHLGFAFAATAAATGAALGIIGHHRGQARGSAGIQGVPQGSGRYLALGGRRRSAQSRLTRRLVTRGRASCRFRRASTGMAQP